MAEILDCHEVREPCPVVYEVSGLNNFFRSSSHLPRINLPTFDRSFDKWESFYSKFKSIHENQSLMTVERMHYLCFCVKRDASNALDHLVIINDNFVIEWNIFVSRYDDERRLITIHLQSVFNLPSLTTETSNDIRMLRDQTNRAIQALSNLSCVTEH